MRQLAWGVLLLLLCGRNFRAADDFPKPYSPPCVERENVFEFTGKPACKNLGADRYEITFAVKGNCDVTVGIIDEKDKVVRHIASGVLGSNAPAPFQKNSLKQTIYWNGKDDLDNYPKEPGQLRLQVRLGLRPVFDKRLGGTSPYNLPGYVVGLAVGPDGAYVILTEHTHVPGFQHATIRKFDRDGNYLQTLVPPPANLPESKLGGMGFVEYESGKRAVQGPDLLDAVSHNARYLPPLDVQRVINCRPVLIGGRLFFANRGHGRGGRPGSFLHYIYTDGATDARGITGVPLAPENVSHNLPQLAVSPDGKRLYLVPIFSGMAGFRNALPATCVYARDLEGENPAAVFAREPNNPGSDNGSFNNAQGIDCDAAGRVYVADMDNNRIQVLSPEGKHLKTIAVDRPNGVSVHPKTGALYVTHTARVGGLSAGRLTKLTSYDNPKEEFHADGVFGLTALDSWSSYPRLWVATWIGLTDRDGRPDRRTTVTIWEERGGKLEKIRDFEAEARKEPGWFTKWQCFGSLGNSKSVCDPTREKLYYANAHIFDLATGAREGVWRHPGATDDIAFDKRGYLHGHFNPGFLQGVGRYNPPQPRPGADSGGKYFTYPECPYDYGVEIGPFAGALPLKDQSGAKGFQDGLGVNMHGDVAVQTNIYIVPKMEDEAREFALQGSKARLAAGLYTEGDTTYKIFLKSIQDAEKRGEQAYFIRRSPGIAPSGGTVWTFNGNGELRKECAVIAGDLINGVQMDEDLSVYFVSARTRVFNDRPFLYGRGGHFGDPKSKQLPFTGTFIKTMPDAFCRVLYKTSPMPLDSIPSRPPELAALDFPDDQADNTNVHCWIEGAEWLYAGASPIVNDGCSCPSQRHHLDWYKRAYLPEAYRHSVGILDSNGNLIMHLGRYANFDSAPGGKDGCKPGETDIGVTCARYLSGTDNYLAFEDWAERIIVLKLDYHAEGIAPVMMK